MVREQITDLKSEKNYMNIYDSLRNSAKMFPNKTAVIEENQFITYGDLVERIDILAEWLKAEFGIIKGERVGLLFVNSINFYISFYAVAKIGAIAVMVNTKMQSEEIAFVLKDTDTHCLLMNTRWFEKIKNIAAEVRINRVLADEEADIFCEGVHVDFLNSVLKNAPSEERFSPSIKEENMTAVILHTSGTTGKPKGIMVSHTNMMGTAYGYSETLRVTDKDITVLTVPVFHILGLSCVSNMFFYIGGTIVVFQRFDTNKVLEAIERYHATHIHSVPAVYIKIMSEAERDYNLDSLRVAVCGGALIGDEDKKKFYEMAPKASFRIAYGLTETAGSGVLSYRHGDPGREVFNCKIQILNEDGNVSEYGEGEALCSGSIVTTKVWGKQDSVGNILHTGDIIRKEKDGSIFILDRIKDVINRGGEKLFPSFIENAIIQYPGIKRAAVFPVRDKLYGEVPAAVLTTENGEKIDSEKLREFLLIKLGKFELPQYIEIWNEEEIPVTGNGKVKKKVLREIFEKKLQI